MCLLSQLFSATTSFFSLPSPIVATLRLLPFGAGDILGVLQFVYVTVLVTISLTCLTPLLLILGLWPLFESKYLALAAADLGPTVATDSQSKCDLAENGDLRALVQDADIGFADRGVAAAEQGEVISYMEHAGEAGMWRRILPLELSGADCGTFGSANVGFEVCVEVFIEVGGGDLMDGVPTQEHGFCSEAIEESGVTFSDAGMERGDIERSDSSDDDVEFEEIDSTVIFEVVEASELFRENGGG